MLLVMSLICWSVENWAIWVRNWLSSTGFIKSWLVSWVTMILRKSSMEMPLSFSSVNTALYTLPLSLVSLLVMPLYLYSSR